MTTRRRWTASLRTGEILPSRDFLSLSLLFFLRGKIIDSYTFHQLQNKDFNEFFRLVAGSPELCACERLQASTLWPKHVMASLFWPHIYLLFDFVASSKAIFIPFSLTCVGSRLLCWH